MAQCSMRFPVSEEKQRALLARFERLGIRENDLQEHFIRAAGPGGQNVNKVATAVCLKHMPSGIEVKCQKARTQGLNRFLARRVLADKLEALADGTESPEVARQSRAKKQKQRRARRSKRKHGASDNPEEGGHKS